MLANPEVCWDDLLFPCNACSEGAYGCDSAAHTALCTRAALSACACPLQPGLRAAFEEGVPLSLSSPKGVKHPSWKHGHFLLFWLPKCLLEITGQYSKEERHKNCVASSYFHLLTLPLSFLLFCNHHINKGFFLLLPSVSFTLCCNRFGNHLGELLPSQLITGKRLYYQKCVLIWLSCFYDHCISQKIFSTFLFTADFT